MWCTYCKKRIGWIEKLLIKCKIVHNCREKYVKKEYKYAVIAGFRKTEIGLQYVSASRLIHEHRLDRKYCLAVSTPAQKAAWSQIIKDLKVIQP